MVMSNTALGFSREYEDARRELENLRTEYASALSRYTELTEFERPNLEAEYMLSIGRKEYRLFCLQLKLRQYKREIALYQMAVNRGETIDPEQVQAIIEREFNDYKAQLEEQQKKIRTAEQLFAAEKLSPEETKAVKTLYHELVRKMHPDLNPDLPPQAAALWNRIVDAYKDCQWKELYLLADMADEMLNGRKDFPESLDSMTAIAEQKKQLEAKLAGLENTIAEIQTRPPFTFRELLVDPEKVLLRRKELDRQIALLNEHLSEVREILDALKGASDHGG